MKFWRFRNKWLIKKAENNGKNNAFTAKLKFIIYFFNVVLLNVTNRNESNFQEKVNFHKKRQQAML